MSDLDCHAATLPSRGRAKAGSSGPGSFTADGISEDEQDAVDYCMQFARRLVAEDRSSMFRLVLIGIGEEVDEEQLDRFEGMFEDTELAGNVDLWSCGTAASMRDGADILAPFFGELDAENTFVADSGAVLDGDGNEIAPYPDGLPAKLQFILPAAQTAFTIRTPRGSATQDITGTLTPFP